MSLLRASLKTGAECKSPSGGQCPTFPKRCAGDVEDPAVLGLARGLSKSERNILVLLNGLNRLKKPDRV
jgi:hypothetical protein